MLTSNHTTLLQPTPKVNNNSVFNLERILQQYASQPDLLELILSSKVEEDRRRAEEAKLKNKEIDYLLQQQKLSENNKDNNDWHSTKQKLPSLSPPPSSSLSSSSTSTTSSTSTSLGKRSSIEWSSSHQTIILPPLTSPPVSHKSTSPRLSSHDINYKNSIQHITSPPSMTELSFDGTKKEVPITINHFQTPPSPPLTSKSSLIKKSSISSLSHHKRRRREMQPVTAIIETREFPYNDNYLWRNNGNTTHKKTGFKSIYYKCANSQQNCPVNKTTLFKGNGEYLIKYRGTHLPDCSTIKRINDI